MIGRPRSVAVQLVASAIALASCSRGARFTRTDDADFLEVRDEYTVLLMHPSFLRAALGTKWDSQTLYVNRPAFSSDCQQIMGVQVPFRPLAKGEPTLVLSCTGWDAAVIFYSVESGESVMMHVDLRNHRIQADAPAKHDQPPRYLPDGGMVFN